MRTAEPTFDEAMALVARVDPQFKPAWDNRSPDTQAAMAKYFLPHRSGKPTLVPTRPRVIKWYCPFASQSEFPTGHRYCINVYTGCAHGCVYCYASAYQPDQANAKQGFRKLIDRDMEDLDRFDVPPAPVHLSNSTDPFQPLEEQTGHTRYALEQILAHRKRFSTVAILTKNPSLPVTRGYLDLFKALLPLPDDHCLADLFRQVRLPGFVVEVSLAFWREEARMFYEPCAPSMERRVEAIRCLREAGIPVAIRIDPLFPRSPLPSGVSLSSFGLPEAQTLEDLEHLVALAAEVKAEHVVFSPVKICKPRGRKMLGPMQAVRRVYEAMAAPGKLDFRGGSWRLPEPVARATVVAPFVDICQRYRIRAKHCKWNLLDTF